VNETFLEPRVGLLIMAGLTSPPSAVLGRDGTLSSWRKDVVAIISMGAPKKVAIAQRALDQIDELPLWMSLSRADELTQSKGGE
jgi:hypothetical protein